MPSPSPEQAQSENVKYLGKDGEVTKDGGGPREGVGS